MDPLYSFYGAERQTDMLTSAWLQSLICKVNATLGQPILVQSMLDWLMGANPVNICLIESVGQENLPQYHHRYSYARNPSGAVPGAIPNGIALISCNKDYAATHDIPYTSESMLDYFGDLPYVLDWPGNPLYRDIVSSNNEVWIPHNAMFLRIFTALNL